MKCSIVFIEYINLLVLISNSYHLIFLVVIVFSRFVLKGKLLAIHKCCQYNTNSLLLVVLYQVLF